MGRSPVLFAALLAAALLPYPVFAQAGWKYGSLVEAGGSREFVAGLKALRPHETDKGPDTAMLYVRTKESGTAEISVALRTPLKPSSPVFVKLDGAPVFEVPVRPLREGRILVFLGDWTALLAKSDRFVVETVSASGQPLRAEFRPAGFSLKSLLSARF